MKVYMRILVLLLLLFFPLLARDPLGFQSFPWGALKSDVEAAKNSNTWQQADSQKMFPGITDITVFSTKETVAEYPATLYYYFYKDSLFQGTVAFDFSQLEDFDFNYNVFISVDRYYREIRKETLTFVYDIFSLLHNKYGKKEPTFKGLDPREIFVKTDNYLAQERWNLRYNPSEFYKRIIAVAYAQWRFPKSEILFSVNISAADKRFDYTLSYSSISMVQRIQKEIEKRRTSGI